MLSVLRLIDRVIGPDTLSPVEKAFVAGAKVMFERLSEECGAVLNRKVSDIAKMPPEIPRDLAPEDSGESNHPNVEAPPKKKPRRSRSRAKKKPETPAP